MSCEESERKNILANMTDTVNSKLESVKQYSGDLNSTISVFKWSKTVCSSTGPLFKPCLEKQTNS